MHSRVRRELIDGVFILQVGRGGGGDGPRKMSEEAKAEQKQKSQGKGPPAAAVVVAATKQLERPQQKRHGQKSHLVAGAPSFGGPSQVATYI